MHALRRTALLGCFALAAGCSDLGNPSPSSPSVKKGELGNGGFTFKCDDSVACDKFNNADTFPTKIASGSNFELEFFVRSDAAGYTHLKDAERGTTIDPVGKFVARGVNGFGAVHPGVATLSARDQKGWLVDYITVEIAKPTSLVVYDAAYKGDSPVRVTKFSVAAGGRREFRTVARQGGENLAGTIAIEWTSSDESTVSVEGYSRGKATLLGGAPGTATLTAKGGGLVETIEVTVTEGPPPPDDGGADGGADASTDEDAGQGGQDGGA